MDRCVYAACCRWMNLANVDQAPAVPFFGSRSSSEATSQPAARRLEISVICSTKYHRWENSSLNRKHCEMNERSVHCPLLPPFR